MVSAIALYPNALTAASSFLKLIDEVVPMLEDSGIALNPIELTTTTGGRLGTIDFDGDLHAVFIPASNEDDGDPFAYVNDLIEQAEALADAAQGQIAVFDALTEHEISAPGFNVADIFDTKHD